MKMKRQFTLLLLPLVAFGANTSAQQQQQQPQPQKPQEQQQAAARQVPAGSTLQAHLNAMHLEAQRHMGQLNSLVLGAAANLTQQQQQQLNGATKFAPVLEALSSVGKAIQQQIGGPNVVQIINSDQQAANSRKNEYQPVEVGPQQQQQQNASSNYREQGEQLRQEIVKRAGQLQQVVASSLELLKNNGDVIVRRLLDQMSARLDQAKTKADRILSEPATNEVALKALSTINLGLNNLNTIITNIVARLDAAAKEHQAGLASGQQQQQQRTNAHIEGQPLAGRLRVNLQQLGQQFQSALNASNHQLGPLMRQRQQQLQQLLASVAQQQQARQAAQAAEQTPPNQGKPGGQPATTDSAK